MIAAVNRSPRCDLRRVGVHDQSEISRLVVLLPIYGRIAIRRYDERAAELSGHVTGNRSGAKFRMLYRNRSTTIVQNEYSMETILADRGSGHCGHAVFATADFC